MGEVSDIVRGSSPRPISDSKWFDTNSKVGWLRISDVTSQQGRIKKLDQHLSKLGEEKTRVLLSPHLLLSIAASVGYPVINYVPTGVHDGFLIFKNPKFQLNYGFYWLQNNKNKWQKYGQPGSQVNLNSSIVENAKIFLPNNNEQSKIIALLLRIDKMLALQQRKLDQLKQLKKAYLSDLFSIKNKPQIRFKGFKGKWKKSKLLDNVSNIIDFRGKTPKKLGMDWSDQGILALSALNVKDGFIDKSIHAHYGDIKLYNKWMAGNKLHKGQVLFTTEAPMGNVAQVPDNDKYILSQRTIAFNVNKDKISDSFLAMLLQTTTVHNQLLSLSSGGTAKGVSQKSLSGLSVAIPLSLEEQRKMEMTFKYINHLIHFQQDKIRYLEENKQFLLQNMFI